MPTALTPVKPSAFTSHLHSDMSPSKKILAGATSLISFVGGTLALTAGAYSMGASAAVFAGVSLAVPPIGMIVAGVVAILFSLYLFTRIDCSSKKQEYILASTQTEKTDVENARKALQDLKKNVAEWIEQQYSTTKIPPDFQDLLKGAKAQVNAAEEAVKDLANELAGLDNKPACQFGRGKQNRNPDVIKAALTDAQNSLNEFQKKLKPLEDRQAQITEAQKKLNEANQRFKQATQKASRPFES